MAEPNTPVDFDFTDPELYARRVPHEEFAELRRTTPVFWSAQPRGRDGFDDDGHWVLTRHADVKDVSRNDAVFSTYENTAFIRYPQGMTRDEIDSNRLILINQDAPQHTKLRQIVSRGFTPRAVNGLRDTLDERARKIVADAAAKGRGEFVRDVACELPLQAIAELIGVPQEDRHKLFEWSNRMISYLDPDNEDDHQTAAYEMLSYAMAMSEDRKECPREDIVTKLVTADIDGHELSSDEFGFFTLVLAVAGNETTRNAITHGMIAFMEHPEQWERYRRERPETAADEIVRWATPVVAFQRTAMADVEVGGQLIKKGDRVGLYYAAANFDPEVFEDPFRFDITRDPNPHLGFGGTGAHYCIGANLARMEIKLIFNEIADQIPDIAKLGEPQRLRSGWINGVKGLQVSYVG
jgi:cholest-4-en-3-one 26-monooxygenase